MNHPQPPPPPPTIKYHRGGPPPRFTVILTSYNRPKLVHWAITTILLQDFRDFELIVADDDSNEETLASIMDAIGRSPNVTVLRQAGGPVASLAERKLVTRYSLTINAALAIAQGEFIKYNCDDDFMYPGALHAFVDAFDANPEALFLYGKSRSISFDKSSFWDSGAPPRVVRTFPVDDEFDYETERKVDMASWWPGWRTPMVGIDHGQFAHRASWLRDIDPPYWPVCPLGQDVADAAFLRRGDLRGHKALAVHAVVNSKNFHSRNEDRAADSEIRE